MWRRSRSASRLEFGVKPANRVRLPRARAPDDRQNQGALADILGEKRFEHFFLRPEWGQLPRRSDFPVSEGHRLVNREENSLMKGLRLSLDAIRDSLLRWPELPEFLDHVRPSQRMCETSRMVLPPRPSS